MRKIFLLCGIFVLVFSILATASMMIPSDDNAKENAKAPEKSPVINENWDLERVDFIHYAKPQNPGKGKPEKEDKCYKLLGVKWKQLPVSYNINPLNTYNLSESFITNIISTSAETWDDVTSSELFNNEYLVDYTGQYGVQNFENTIDFGSLSDNNIIAVTSIWYTRRGKQIVEFDIRFNTIFNWGDATTNTNLMDLQNIAIHELGHGIGLDDIYTQACSNVTMYGYSGEGDISKRSLEAPDIQGLQDMYGA